MGVCVLIKIGLVINTIRIGRLLHQKSDVKSVELADNYEGLQVCKVISGSQIYRNVIVIAKSAILQRHKIDSFGFAYFCKVIKQSKVE